jgi:hypothetical protein
MGQQRNARWSRFGDPARRKCRATACRRRHSSLEKAITKSASRCRRLVTASAVAQLRALPRHRAADKTCGSTKPTPRAFAAVTHPRYSLAMQINSSYRAHVIKRPLSFTTTRFLTLALFSLFGVLCVLVGFLHGAWNTVFMGASFIMLGVFCFFQPILLHVPLREILRTSRAAAIGPIWLRTSLSVLAIGLLLIAKMFLFMT